MPTTPRGIEYPDSSGHTRLWEHLQTLAEDVDGLVDDLAEPPLARFYLSANKSIAAGAEVAATTLVADLQYPDAAAWPAGADSSSRQITRTGIYRVTYQVNYSSGGTAARSCRIRKSSTNAALSGTIVAFGRGIPGADTLTISMTITLSLTAGEYLNFSVGNADGSTAREARGGSSETWVEIEYLRAA
jgi:hypothetical protein